MIILLVKVGMMIFGKFVGILLIWWILLVLKKIIENRVMMIKVINCVGICLWYFCGKKNKILRVSKFKNSLLNFKLVSKLGNVDKVLSILLLGEGCLSSGESCRIIRIILILDIKFEIMLYGISVMYLLSLRVLSKIWNVLVIMIMVKVIVVFDLG